MNIKKGISLAAFGFLFVLVNINITLFELTINLTPDFVGWILMFLSFEKLGSYAEGKNYLKWMALVMAVFTAAEWIIEITMPGFDISVVSWVFAIVSAVFLFIYLGIIEKVAHDVASSNESTIRMLRILIAVLNGVWLVLELVILIGGVTDLVKILLTVTGVAVLAATVFMAVVLFRLRKEVNEERAEVKAESAQADVIPGSDTDEEVPQKDAEPEAESQGDPETESSQDGGSGEDPDGSDK